MAIGIIDQPGGAGNPKRIPSIPTLQTIGGLPTLSGGQRRCSGIGSFTPLQATSANLLLWTKDTGTNQTASGLPSSINNDPVGEWLDQSGHANNLVQTTSGSRPSFQTNQVNGLPAILFNGTSQSVSALFTVNVPFDIFAVLKQITWAEGANLLSGGSGDEFTVEQHGVTPSLYIWNGGALGGTNTDLPLNTWALLEAGMPLTSPNCYLRVNLNAPTVGGGAGLAARSGITLAAHPGPANFCNMALAEVAVYDAILSGAEQAKVQTYFGTKYGLF